MKITKKTAFTLVELMIVVWLTGLMATFWLLTLSHNKIKMAYDESSNNILEFMKEARIYWMSNYIEISATWSMSTWYTIPDWWYWFQIEKWIWTWVVALKLFYNKDEDVLYSSWSDLLIKEFESGRNTIYFDKIYWSWTALPYPNWNSTWSVSDTNTWTIVFRNMIWDFPNDWSVFISSWSWSNNLKTLFIEFYLLEQWEEMYKRRVLFDRLKKSIVSQSCRVSNESILDDCWAGKKWVLWF
jgi:hypothetical protein